MSGDDRLALLLGAALILLMAGLGWLKRRNSGDGT